MDLSPLNEGIGSVNEVLTNILSHKLVISAAIIAALLGVRFLFVRLIRQKSEVLSEEQRRRISRAKNGVFAIILFALITIWWPELRQFALSIAAVAVAFVIASKELILCFSGAVLRTTSRSATVGDWVEVGDIRGEVIDQNILSSVIQEIDKESSTYSYTGRTITLPNSVFLTQPVKNMNFMRRFVFHKFAIHTEPKVNVFEAKQLIMEKLQAYCEEFTELGKRYHSFIVQRSGMEIPTPEPSISVSTTTLGKNIFSVTVFCPTPQAAEIEQRIVGDFMEFYYKRKAELSKVTSDDSQNEG